MSDVIHECPDYPDRQWFYPVVRMEPLFDIPESDFQAEWFYGTEEEINERIKNMPDNCTYILIDNETDFALAV